MEEKKKSNKDLVVTVVVLAIALVGTIGYICYDKVFSASSIDNVTTEEKKSEENDSSSSEDLDINSKLVQNLYNTVAPRNNNNSSCSFGWNYGNSINEDFYSDKTDEKIKMSIVGANLNESMKHNYNDKCDNVPDSQDGYSSVCYYNKNGNTSYGYQSAYSKEYVESLYKYIFGMNATLDTSVPITVSSFSARVYYYISSLDRYVLYVKDASSICGGDTVEELKSASKNANEIKLYAELSKYDMDKLLEKANYVYTFQLEDDGMYKFISRVKES